MYFILMVVILYFILISILGNKPIIDEIIAIVLLGILTLLIGFRYNVGIDYSQYEFDFIHNNYYYEPIYSFITYIVKYFNGEFYHVTLIMSTITNCFIYFALKNYEIRGKLLILAILVYTSNLAFIYANLMRQGVAITIFLYCSRYIKERNFKKYLLFMIIASGFHTSALILIPLYFIKNIKMTRKKVIGFVFISYMLVALRISQGILIFLSQFMGKYSKYNQNIFLFGGEIDLFSPMVLINVILMIVLISNKNKIESLSVNYYIIGVILNVLSLSSFMYDRIGIYFSIFSLIAIPKLIIIRQDKIRYVQIVFCCIVLGLYILSNLFINATANNLIYQSIF